MSGQLHPTSSWQRSIAALCASLVLALTLASSATVHGWLHAVIGQQSCSDHESLPTAPEHRCAVVLFAAGVDMPLVALAIVPPRLADRLVVVVRAAEFYLSSPRYLRQPERGPPASRVA